MPPMLWHQRCFSASLTQTTFTSLALTTSAPEPQSPKPKGRANDCRPETRVNQKLFANAVEGKAKSMERA